MSHDDFDPVWGVGLPKATDRFPGLDVLIEHRRLDVIWPSDLLRESRALRRRRPWDWTMFGYGVAVGMVLGIVALAAVSI